LSIERRREVVNRQHPSLSIVRQCSLLDISRSGLYYQPKGISEEDLTFMKVASDVNSGHQTFHAASNPA